MRREVAPGDWFKVLTITVLGSGFAPFASGSWGSLAAVLLYLPLLLAARTLGWSAGSLAGLTAVGILLACIWSIQFGEWAIARFGRKDPKQFVLDEFAGQWIALLWLPIVIDAGWATVAAVLFVQLFFFRLTDVLKVPPAAQFERLPAGWGVLFDDLAAGVYALLLGHLFWRFLPAAEWLGLPLSDFGGSAG